MIDEDDREIFTNSINVMWSITDMMRNSRRTTTTSRFRGSTMTM